MMIIAINELNSHNIKKFAKIKAIRNWQEKINLPTKYIKQSD